MISFFVLGDIGVSVDGVPCPVEPGMACGLLASLLLSPNRFVPASRLVHVLWEVAPASAQSNLRTYATRLRRALTGSAAEQRLTGQRGTGYRMIVRDGELDHQVFQRLVRDSRADLHTRQFARAAAALRQALSLWRGAAGGHVPPRSQVARQLEVLNDDRLAAIEDLVEARLAMGDQQALVGELRWHIAQHPWRERPYGQLMRALYQAGEATAALAVYDELRVSLGSELGTAPSNPLQALQRAVLRGDDRLLAPGGGGGELVAGGQSRRADGRASRWSTTRPATARVSAT